MSVPFVRAAGVYDRTVHWRETTYQGYALHKISLSQMKMAPHTLCDNCHEKLELLGIRVLSELYFSLLNLCLNITLIRLIFRLFNWRVRMKMIDSDCIKVQMTVQSKYHDNQLCTQPILRYKQARRSKFKYIEII